MTEPKYTPDFQDFWYSYPSRVSDAGTFVKVGKYDAFVQWRKLPVEIRQKCLMLVKNKMVKSSKFTQDACRFLSHRRWEDYPDYAPRPKEKNNGCCVCGKPASMTVGQKSYCLSHTAEAWV
jgi:hypothetical protein